MRTMVAAAVACLSVVGLSVAADVQAFTKRDVSIPAGGLGPALQALSAEGSIHVVFISEDVNKLSTKGASGSLTIDEALNQLLNGTGLTFQYIDDETVSIVPLATTPAARATGTSGQRFRLAQAETPSRSPRQATAENSSENFGERATLEEIIVTAQKREENVNDVPISMTVLSGTELDSTSVGGVSEVLNTVPGIVTTSNYLSGGSTIAIRGVTAARPLQVGAGTVGYYLDAVPFSLVKSAVGPDSNPYDLERVEVLRGPQGTLYGASALNGVVRILTHDADLNRFDFKATTAGSNTTKGGANFSGDAALNVPLIEGKLALRAVAGYQDNEGWIDQPNKADANNEEIQTYRLKIKAQPSDRLTLGLSAWISRNRGGAPSVGYEYDKTSSVLDQPTKNDFETYGFTAGYDFNSFRVASTTGYLSYSNAGTLGLDIPAFNAPNTIFFNGLESEIFSQELTLQSSTEGAWRWSLGGIYREGTEDTTQYYTGLYASVPFILAYNKSKSYAVYGELTRLLFDERLELTGGLRYFHDEETQDSQTGRGTPFKYAEATSEATTPRVIATWHHSDDQMVYASYSQGFRAGFPQGDAVLSSFPTFPAVKPDRLHNYEVGLKGILANDRVSYDVALYYIDWEDIQLLLRVPFLNSPGVNAVINGQSARGMGVDASVALRPTDALTLRASVSKNDLGMSSDVRSTTGILFRKGDRPNGSPSTTTGASADYAFDLNERFRGRLQASASYSSPITYRTETVVGKADSILITRASFTVEADEHWSVSLFADNLNNEKGTAAKAFITPYAADWNSRVRPRTIGVRLNYNLY